MRRKAILVMVIGLFFFISDLQCIYASEQVSSGTCGEGTAWVLDDEGTLTISGTGAMDDYETASASPWYSSKSSIKKVIVGDQITRIGARAFYNCPNLNEIKIGLSVGSIGSWALYNLAAIEELTIPASMNYLENSSIRSCQSLEKVYFIGNAPSIGSNVFSSCSENLHVSSHPGTDGWSSDTWAAYSIIKEHITI